MLDRSLALRLNGPWATSGGDSSKFVCITGARADKKDARALFQATRPRRVRGRVKRYEAPRFSHRPLVDESSQRLGNIPRPRSRCSESQVRHVVANLPSARH
jgi:hypothetical protein